jgi:hypothetical protein
MTCRAFVLIFALCASGSTLADQHISVQKACTLKATPVLRVKSGDAVC